MSFEIIFAKRAQDERKELKATPAKAGLPKQINKALAYLQTNPRRSSLHTHVFSAFENPFEPAGKVFEAYAQNKTSGAYRIFWCYGPEKLQITILAITPHP